jgi:NAD dependent epimerase/dehydratase family enzyme
MRVPSMALKIALGDGLAETLLTGQRAVPARLERAGFAFEFQDLSFALAALLQHC